MSASVPNQDVKAEGLKLTKAQRDFLIAVLKGQDDGWFASFDRLHHKHAPTALSLRAGGYLKFTTERPRIFVTEAGRASLPPTSTTGG